MFPGNPLAVIFRPARSAMTSGKARSGQWKLRFEPQAAPFVEPLMGWTGSEDTLRQVELAFPTAEAAVRYARRQGLQYELRGSDIPEAGVRNFADRPATPAASKSTAPGRRLEWLERTLEPDLVRTGARCSGPSSRYASPGEVLRDVDLSAAAKRDVLHCWAFDLVAEALAKPDSGASTGLLDSVIDALLDLEEAKLARLPPTGSGSPTGVLAHAS
jgi:hypothetical protein